MTLSDSKNVKTLFAEALELHRKGEITHAITAYQKIIEVFPTFAQAHNNLGVALRSKGLYLSSAAAYKRALTIAPKDSGTLSNLGNVLRALGKFSEAADMHRLALIHDPNYLEAKYNLGLALKDMGKFSEAIKCLDSVIEINPNHAQAHWDRSLTYLQSGDLKRGFVEYEWRWKLNDNPPRNFSKPLWDGEPLNGRTLLIHCEQGMGDSIQFSRYINLLFGDSQNIILECQPPLKRLFTSLKGPQNIIGRGCELPEFDFHVPLLTLPKISGTTLETIPKMTPYLANTSEDYDYFNKIVTAPKDWLKVGLCWAGKPSQKNDLNRSCGLAPMLELVGTKNVMFYSLQVGQKVSELDSLGASGLIKDLSPKLKDFGCTAGAIKNLDLVISVDTSVAHLAGALNIPLWIPLTFTGDWRYLCKKTTTEWYSSAKIFQQDVHGDWTNVFRKIKVGLEKLVDSK